MKNSFDKAIRTFGREGILSFKALANERAGAYYLALGDSNWAATYLTRAHDLYLDWGAGGKARQMEGKYGANLIQTSNRIPQTNERDSIAGTRSCQAPTCEFLRLDICNTEEFHCLPPADSVSQLLLANATR